jgi:hypothetical protein
MHPREDAAAGFGVLAALYADGSPGAAFTIEA